MTKKVNNDNNKVNNGKEVVNMRKGLRNTLELCKVNLEKGIATWKMHDIFMKAGDEKQAKRCLKILNKKASIAAGINYAQQKAIKSEIKNIDTIIIRGVEINCYLNDLGEAFLVCDASVKAGQESVLTRENGLGEVTMADDKMCLKREGTYDLLSVKIGSSYDGFEMQQATIEQFVNKGILVVFNKKTGIAKIVEENVDIDSVKIKRNECVYKYEYLGITPSGLKTRSLSMYVTAKREFGKKAVRKDNRINLLDTTLGQGFVHTFMEGNAFKLFEKKKAFKLMGRVLLGAPGSKEMGSINNYIVFNNIAEKASYVKDGKIVDCQNTQDGAIFIALEKIMEQEKFKDFSRKDLIHQCVQARGANNALKGASEILSRKSIEFLAKSLLSNNTTVEYIVLNNERICTEFDKVNGKKVVVKSAFDKLTEEQKEQFFNNIDMIADTNAIKIYEHEGEFKLVWMKHAYTSESSLNMVVNMMLTSEDPVKGINIINKLVKRSLAKKFSAFGFDIELDEEARIVSSKYCVETRKNNEGQFSSFLMKNSPKTMMYLLPSILKGMISSTLEGVSNMMNLLKAEMNSLYTVVQADPTPLFGQRILKEKEVYAPSFKGFDEVSGVRHPISGPKAITTFKTVELKEIVERISKLNVNYEIKEFLCDYYKTVKSFAIIPASHYLMEKHDGMDFDIDAMQFILEKEVVEVLKGIEEVGTVIEEEDPNARYIITNKEKLIAQFKEEKDHSILDMSNLYKDKEEVVLNKREEEVKNAKIDNDFCKVIKTNKVKENKNNVKLDFNGMLDLAFKFFKSDVDPIGIIATGFYNNFLINSYLKSSSTATEDKEKVAKIFASYYGCSETKNPYKKQLKRRINAEGFNEIVLSKDACTNIIFAYHESDGSVKSTIDFLDECMQANRYIAETSIDAAKNDYKIIDMFNHTKVLKALGSDKALTVKVEKKDFLFESICEQLSQAQGKEYSNNNMFDTFLLDYSSDKKNKGIMPVSKIKNVDTFLTDMEEQLSEYANEYGFDLMNGIGVEDILYNTKKDLVNYTNSLIVFAVKELEMYVSNYNAEAVAAREDILNRAKECAFNNKFFDAKRVCKTLLSNITDVFMHFDDVTDYDDKNSKLYLKNEVVKIFKNTLIASFKGGVIPMTDAEIGLCLLATIVEMNQKHLAKGKVGSTHSTALNIFDEYINAFLESDGVDCNAYEEIICGIKNNKTVSLDGLVGQEVEFVEGVCKVDGILLKSKDKHLNFAGTIIKDESHFYVMNKRETVEKDFNLGIYIPMKKQKRNGIYDLTTEFGRRKLELDMLSNVHFVFKEEMNCVVDTDCKKNMVRSSLVGQGVRGGKVLNYVACELYTNLSVINLLKDDKDVTYTAFYNERVITDNDSLNSEIAEKSGFVQCRSNALANALSIINEKAKPVEEENVIEEDVNDIFTNNNDDFIAPIPEDMQSPVLEEKEEDIIDDQPLVAGAEEACPIPVEMEEQEEEEEVIVNEDILLAGFEF